MTAIRIEGQFGRVVARQRAAGQDFLQIEHQAGLNIRHHEHARSHLVIVVAGAYAERSGDHETVHDAGWLTFHPAGSSHANRVCATGGQAVAVELSDTLLREAHDDGWFQPDCSHSVRAPRLCHVLAAEMRTTDTAAPLAIAGLMFESLALLHRTRTTPDRRPSPGLRRAEEALHELNPGIATLDALAAMAGCSRSQLVRQFRHHWGVSPGQRLRQLRVERALALLSSGREPLARIALECGFADQSHMTREVRRETGRTPSECSVRRRLT